MSTIDLEPIQNTAIFGATPSWGSPVIEAVERGFAFFLFAAASPVVAASALAVTVLSRRSPFVAHLRVGKDGTPFWMWKLRSMWSPAERASIPRECVEYIVADTSEEGKDQADPRVTSRFAAFCRRHSIDELPQLWHVVRGEMSLVGPRPLTRSEVVRFYGDEVPSLLSVKPGLTGLWQVYGRSAVRFPQRAAMDLKLVRSLTLKLYIEVLLRTLPAVIRGNGAW